ncbi:hypothetical protein [Actinobacillus arthritidis]|uniref:hypothetical protein n=1 Tax=Actinobacillus arthritidis TaxID=157339 RepID=UPI0024428EF8|nr:hypothetical protein [Actinobacillus arthritidis]WGE89511.1 hypothetical protein NYR89_00645 [Actinobacillus arthritidis]
MWSSLPTEQKERYQTLITNFASLSEAFSQKVEDAKNEIVAPIVNSKFQETAFQKSFNAISEDIANTSYDASVKLSNGEKYLVGIKSFGYESGDQKIAQFKSVSVSDEWTALFEKIKVNAKGREKEEADSLNKDLYRELALKIASLRNNRIASSKAQIRGFNGESIDVKAVYHVLMTSKKGKEPTIYVGEASYLPINIDNLEVLGSTTAGNPTNFKFRDENHTYKYTSADSQLLMTFDNKNIVKESWNVKYIKNPFSVFENLHNYIDTEELFSDSVSWVIYNNKYELEESSGFNAFDGSTKLPKNKRKLEIKRIESEFYDKLPENILSNIIALLNEILLKDWSQQKIDIQKRKTLRKNLIKLVEGSGETQLLTRIEKLVFRSSTEMYIPIPDSKEFHNQRPDFFGEKVGTFKNNGKTLALDKEQRKFKLEFLASGNIIEAYINQDLGKAIQSIHNQDILGKWVLWEVFQLQERELLTIQKLNEIGINGIRLIKFKDTSRGIGLDFIWIDPENPPADAIGWVAKNKKTEEK